MIEDIREMLDEGAEVEFDLVIVGAGPAGMSLALELVGSGLKVAILEAGGRTHPGAEEAALYEGETTGLAYPVAGSRQRFFGGTSNHWGGWCRPLDDSDLAEREWMSLSGWPLGHQELAPYYQRAHEVLEIPSDDYDMEQGTSASALLPADSSSGFLNTGFRFSPPTRFAEAYGDVLASDPDTTVLLHAAVTGLEHDDNGHVQAARVRTLEGGRYTVRAGRFVLAAGGLEVPRLLLHTGDDERSALGNQSNLLGRCFMEHYGYTPGFVMTRAELKYHRHDGRGGALMPVLAPRPALMAAEQLNNACLLLDAVEPDSTWPPEALATPGLARALDGPAWRYRVTMINEPSPNRDSRVTLSDEHDALGMRKLKLHWAIAESDLAGVDRMVVALGRWLGSSGLGRLQYTRPVSPETTESFSGGMHHMGTTRMSRDNREGVVNSDCRVFGTDNLYIASSSVFPTAGYANPTLTIVALAVRLAEHLKGGEA